MKRKLPAGQTSVSLPIFIQDTSSTTGGGLSGVTFASSGLVIEYRRRGQSSWSTSTPVTKTLGTFVSWGIVADGSLAGAYELDLPDAAFASGARWVVIRVRGVANMLPCLIEIELDVLDYQTAAGGAVMPTVAGRTLDVSAGGEAGIDWANVGSPTFTLALTGTTVSPSQVAASVSGAVGSVTGSVGGNVVGSVGSVMGAVGSVTGAVGSVTGSVGSVSGSVGSVASGGITAASFAANAVNASALAADAVTEIQNGVVLATLQPNYAPAIAGDAMTLTVGERTSLATVLEAAMLNEGDATALLAAIAAKVEQFLINEGDSTATMAAIAAAVRTNLATELARIDVTISSRNSTTPPAAAAIRAEIDSNSTQLAKLGAPASASIAADIALVKVDTATAAAEVVKIPRSATTKAAGAAVTKTNSSVTPSQTLTEAIT